MLEKCLYGRTVLDDNCLRPKGTGVPQLNTHLCRHGHVMQAQLALALLTKTLLARMLGM